MRALSSSFLHDVLPTLDLFMKQTKETRVFRRAQAVREVAAGQTVKGPTELKLRPDIIESLVYPQDFPYYSWHWHFTAIIDEKSPVTDPKRRNNAGSARNRKLTAVH